MSTPGAKRTSLNRWVAGGVALALVIPLVVLAIRAEGFHATKVNLNDAGVWVVNWNRGVAGRINTQTASIEVSVPAPAPPFDLAQVDETVLLNVPVDKAIVPVDVALARLGDPVDVPDGGLAVLGGATGALSDPAAGKVWTTDRARVTQVDTANTPPVFEAGAAAVVAVGTDGTTYGYAPGASEVHVAAPGADPTTEAIPPMGEHPQVTAVGDRVVVLDGDAARLVVPGQVPVDLADRGDNPVLQQPGPDRDEVLVATDDALLSVALDSGEIGEVAAGGTGSAVAPVWLDGCAFGAWMARPHYVQACTDRDLVSGDVAGAQSGGPMQYRTNRNRVVLNDTRTGVNLLFTDDKPLEISNWDDALDKDKKEETQEEIVEKQADACDAATEPPVLSNDFAGTRPGRPVVVAVLENDLFPRCDVPVVSVPTPPDPQAATVEVIRGGTAVQVTPAEDRTLPVTFVYEVATQSGPQTATVQVDIAQADTNSAPIAEDDRSSVVAGRSVRHDVLSNDHDPEGDALTLTAAQVDDGTIAFRSSGEVAYTASGTPGLKTVTYTVSDQEDSAEGTLTIEVSEADTNVGPTARNDRVSAVVGGEASVALLANDSDPNGDPLQVATVERPADLDVSWDDKGELRVRPRTAGTWLLVYTITDGEKTADAQVRVDVTDVVANRPPVAVRDDLAARPGVPGYLDLVANDTDPDGDLLAVVAVAVPPEIALTVELLDKHIVRVTAPAGFDQVVVVRYTVSDGQASSEGALVVRPFLTDGVDQSPIVGADEVTVRAGTVGGIGVIENDLDPEGERLTLVGVGTLAEGEGQIFVEGDQLRYVAPTPGPATVRVSYTVADPGGNRVDGSLTIRVVPADNPNQPPRGPRLEARVFAGSEIAIPVPVVGIDPDGDQVFVVSVSEPPGKGHAVPIAAGFSYRADRGASGTDTFSFTVRDALGLEATGTVRIAIVPRPVANSNPVAVPDRKSTRPGTSVPIAVLANDSDPDGDPLTLLVDGKDAPTRPRIGAVSINPEGTGLVFEAPADALPGEVSLSYAIADGRGGSARGVVTITIERDDIENRAPIARDDTAPLQSPGSTVDVEVLANDVDPDSEGDPLQVAIVTPGVDAQVVDGGTIRVTVADRSVVLVYEISDVDGATARALVSVPVLELRPPVCETPTVDVAAGDSVRVPVLDACRDPAGGDLELVRVLAERGGTVRIDGDAAVFTAAAEVKGDAGFSFLVNNGTTAGYGGVIVRVSGQDFPPTFARTSVELPAGGTRTIDLSALVTDLNAEDTHTFASLSGVTAGVTASIEGTTLQVSAGDDAKGARVALTLDVSDGTNTVGGQVDVRVLAHDGAPPTAVDDVGETFQTKAKVVDVTANDIDPIGSGLSVISVGRTTGGEAAVEGEGSIRFTPSAEFVGEATVVYTVTDASKDSDRQSSATVRISVIGFPTKPGVPSGVRDTRLVRLTWGAAQPQGSPITEYVVENRQGTRLSAPSNALVFDGLTNGTGYEFRVAARNLAVENDSQLNWSDWSPVITPDTTPGVPEAPRLLFGDQRIHVSWTAPVNEGTPITNYQVRISGQSVGETRDLGTATEMDWAGLVNGQSYVFTVRARNDADYGEWSANSIDAVNSVPAAVPGPVPGVDAHRLDRDTAAGGWVEVTWGAPIANGDPNFTFVVSVSPADAPAQTIPNATARRAEFSGLRNGVSYTFTVTAANKAGTGPGASSSPATPAARPDPISDLRAEPGDGRVRLTVDAAGNNGAAIDSYEVSANGGNWAPLPLNTSRVGTVNATNGNPHTYRVRACNVVGCSDPGPTSNRVIPFGPPNVTSSVNGSVVTFRWADQNGVDTYSVSGANGTRVDRTTYQVDLGPGPARDTTITVTADGQGVQQATTATGRSEATQSIAIAWGISAAGYPVKPDNHPCSANCQWIEIRLRGFAPNTLVNLECRTSSTGGEVFATHQVTTDGNGNADQIPAGSGPSPKTCFLGRTGEQVWVIGNGIRSNTIVSP